jgi:competence protein ComEC
MIVVFSYQFPSFLFIFVAYVIYFRKHLNLIIGACIISIFIFRMMFFMVQMDQINGEVRVVRVQTYEYNERVTVSYHHKRYVFYTFKGQYKLGDKLQLEAYVVEFEKPTRPFGFDVFKYYLGNNIHGKLEITQVEFIKSSYHVLSFRDHMLNRIQPLKSSALLSALWFGENNDLDQETLSSWNILYLFKVTGFHVYAFLLLIKKLFVENSFVYKVLHISVLILFWYLQAFHMTMFRYILLWLIVHVLKGFNIRLHSVTIVLIAFFIQLLIYPYLMFNLGFILGYCIVFFIRIMTQWIPYDRSLLSTYQLSIHVSILIGLLIQRLYVISILLMPLFIWFVAYVLFIGSTIVLMMPVFDDVLYQLYEKFILILQTFEHVQIALFIPSIKGMYHFIFVGMILWIFVSKTYAIMVKKTYMLILLLGMSFISIQLDKSTHLYFLDVGQGDALIMKSESCVTVIDAFEGVRETLQGFGIHHIDYFFLTHNDLDHTKEKEDVMNTFYVHHAYTSRFQDIDGFQAMPMNRVLTCGDIEIKALSPNKDYHNDNDNSLVLMLSIQDVNILLMGDAGTQTEEVLIKEYGEELKADVLKVGHHGSYTSTSKRFLDFVNPSYAVISVGRNNRYGMPHADVLNTLNMSSTIIYRTDSMGTIHFEFNQHEMLIHTFL